MPRNRVQSLLGATQKTLEEWGEKIKEKMQVKEKELFTYEEKKRQLLPQLLEAHEKGVSARELAQITGINHTTIATWIKEAKRKEKEQDAKNEQS